MTPVVHVVVPDGVDDSARPSGGNVYDRQICTGLSALGWTVKEYPIVGDWPRPHASSYAALAEIAGGVPTDDIVLIDGLIASTASEVLLPQAGRLRMVVLMHMPLGHAPDATLRMQEREVLLAAAAVITTSEWTRQRLLQLYALPPERVHVAHPGVDAAELAPTTPNGGSLVCVAAVTPGKGHDLFLDALAAARDMDWRLVCVGSTDRDPGYTDHVRKRIDDLALDDRITFVGAKSGTDLEQVYAAADLLVLPTRTETYGMVITEALARGLPVITTRVGGVPEAMGHGDDGTRPGLLMAPEDPAALGSALRAWLGDASLRARLRQAAHERRTRLKPWSATASRVAEVLAASQ